MTGVLAVGAASWVGWNQLQLQKRQTRLIENDLKIQLLEKRTACVRSMREIFYEWHAHVRLEHEQWRNFYNLMDEVELLFPKDVYDDIAKAVDGTLWSKLHYERALQYHGEGKTDIAQERSQKSWDEEENVSEVMPRLLNAMVRNTRIDAWE